MSESAAFVHPQRIADLRALLVKEKLDAIVIADIENARYISDFTGSNALIILTAAEAVFLTDGRYKIQAARETSGWSRIILPQGSDLAEAAGEEIGKRAVQRAAFESQHLTVDAFEHLKSKVPQSVELVGYKDLVEMVRRVKDANEIGAIRRAVTLADSCFDYIRTIVKPGVTELELAWMIEVFLREQGASALSFSTIVASGPHSALPHARPSDRIISKNGETEFVLFDYGCVVDGYCSDITRTVIVGTPTDAHRRLYDSVRNAQQAALDAIRPGIPGKDVDTLVRDLFTKEGQGEAFPHGLGHQLGRDVHDGACFSQKSEVVLQKGIVATVEPGLYIEGFGGVRIEDDVVVTETGCEVLTQSTKELVVVG